MMPRRSKDLVVAVTAPDSGQRGKDRDLWPAYFTPRSVNRIPYFIIRTAENLGEEGISV